jgi:hypothetical protein
MTITVARRSHLWRLDALELEPVVGVVPLEDGVLERVVGEVLELGEAGLEREVGEEVEPEALELGEEV